MLWFRSDNMTDVALLTLGENMEGMKNQTDGEHMLMDDAN